MAYVPKGTVYPGVLSQPIELPGQGLLEKDEEFRARLSKAIDTALEDRWAALFAHFKIDRSGIGCWVDLACAPVDRI